MSEAEQPVRPLAQEIERMRAILEDPAWDPITLVNVDAHFIDLRRTARAVLASWEVGKQEITAMCASWDTYKEETRVTLRVAHSSLKAMVSAVEVAIQMEEAFGKMIGGNWDPALHAEVSALRRRFRERIAARDPS